MLASLGCMCALAFFFDFAFFTAFKLVETLSKELITSTCHLLGATIGYKKGYCFC